MGTGDPRLAEALADRYVIGEEIGSGGMATVFAAADLRHRRRVAVKVFRPVVAAAIGPERFRTEIEVTANLQHPNILPLFDSGEAAGMLYYVMPLVDGESLRARLARGGRLPEAEAVAVATAVADALDYAHSRGVLHRDVKPENIMLSHGHALVCDFGVGKVLWATGSAPDTRLEGLVGTPAYMSPEQLEAEPDLDARSDLFSLGCVLFEMLTGEPLAPGATPYAVLARRAPTDGPSLGSRLAGASRSLRAVVARLLEPRPADRYGSGREVVAALRAASGDGGAPARPAIAVLPLANLSSDPEDEFFADGMTEEIINALAQLPGLHVASRTSSFHYKGGLPDLATVGRQLGVGLVLEGSVRKSGDRARITAQLIDVARDEHLWSAAFDRELTDVFGVQDEIAAAVATRLRVLLAAPDREPQGRRHPEAYELFLKGRVLQYRRGAAIRDAMACFERALALDPEYADAHAWLGDSYRLLAIYGALPSADALPRARRAAERALALDPAVAEAHATLADVRFAWDHDVAGAHAGWARALELDPGHVRARCEHAVRLLCLHEGRMDDAIAETRRAREADPLSAYAAGMHAMVLGVAGWLDQARTEAATARELDPASFLGHWMGLEIALWCGDGPGALELAPPALALSGRHPWIVAALAHAYRLVGRIDAARATVGELELRAQHEYVQRYALARAAAGAGLVDRAVELVDRAITEHDAMIMAVGRMPSWAEVRRHPAYPALAGRLRLPV